jgi:hypothetical protein
MITRENLSEIIKSLNQKEIKRLKNSNKEYCVIYLHVFNTGAYATIKLTDNFNRYQYVSNNGNCIIETQEVINILNN